uniref:Sperm microtubule inner protein 6 n=1 Tax=Sphenodon punctatus TaxID=8508 RepID=A0A8D0GUG7_SPHPU
MFLFVRKTKTPVSTYVDHYKAPQTKTKTFEEPPMTLWRDNKFVTQGLKMPRTDNQVDQSNLEKMVTRAVQEYSFKNSIDPTAYRPEKYWLTRPEGTAGPLYATWRTGPYNSAAWNRYTTYLPRLPKVKTWYRCVPLTAPLVPSFSEREVVVNMLNSLSRHQLPSLQHRYVIPGRMPYQGYYSPCTGRHYCLRGMDYYVDGAPCNERHLNQLVEKIEYPILRPQPRNDALCTVAQPAAIFPVYEP